MATNLGKGVAEDIETGVDEAASKYPPPPPPLPSIDESVSEAKKYKYPPFSLPPAGEFVPQARIYNPPPFYIPRDGGSVSEAKKYKYPPPPLPPAGESFSEAKKYKYPSPPLPPDDESSSPLLKSDDFLFANWADGIEGKVCGEYSEEPWKTASIYKVPAYKRELNPRAFTPMFVSFGPFHHYNPKLQKMTIHKERALVHFLIRAKKSFYDIMDEVNNVIAELRNAYCCLDDRWEINDTEFLKMMILDGCFMLEILQKLELLRRGIRDERGYSDQDPYFSINAANHKWSYIKRDMLLIENQLPLLLLKTLLFGRPNEHADINKYINGLVLNLVVENGYTSTSTTMGLHALDLYRHSLLSSEPQPQQIQSELNELFENNHYRLPQPTAAAILSQILRTQFEPRIRTSQIQPEQPQTQQELNIIRCAVELDEAGVMFKKSETNNLKKIKFESGKFHLPFLMVDDATGCSLLNVITFEYLHVNLPPDVTIYVTVMDEVIDSANDVRLLREKGLILNTLGSDEEVARIFNGMGREITMHHDDHLAELRKNVSEYCRKRMPRWRAYFVSTYFKNPWTIFSLIGALLVITLTIVQTVYAASEK